MTAGGGRQRSQEGFTLIEVMLVVFVSSIIVLPLLGWMIMAFRVETQVKETSAEVLAENLLGAYFGRDVVAAKSGAVGGVDCAGGEGSGGEVVLSLAAGSGATNVVYSAVAAKPGFAQIWRRACPGVGGLTDSETLVIEEAAVPAGGWASALVCGDRPGRSADTCGQVQLTFTMRNGDTVEAAASRRIGAPQ